MTPADWAILIGAMVALLTSVAGGALFLANVNHRAGQAQKDLDEYKVRNEKDNAELKLRIASMEKHHAEVAVLSSQMTMVIQSVAKLSIDVQNLTQALIERAN